MQAMQHDQTRLSDTSYEETPLLGDFMHPEDKKARLEEDKAFIKARFLRVDFRKIGPLGFSQKRRSNQDCFIGPKNR